jgi:hypothetical protein
MADAPAAPDEPADPVASRLDLGLKVAGTIVAVLLATLVGIYGTFLTPFRIGTALVPVSLLIAGGGIVAAVWIAYQTTGNRFLALLPCLAWLIIAFISALPTRDGDLVLLGNNWVAYVHLLVGLITAAACAYRLNQPSGGV